MATTLPDGRHAHAAIAVRSSMYLLGGASNVVTASVLIYDSTQDTWAEVALMPANGGMASPSCVVAWE
jgi:hypothetical protein